MLTTAAKLNVVSTSGQGHSHQSGAAVDLHAGDWRNYSTGVCVSAHPSTLRMQIDGPAGIFEIGSIAIRRVSSDVPFLQLTSQSELQSLRGAGGLLPLSGGASATFFCFGPAPQLLLPDSALDSLADPDGVDEFAEAAAVNLIVEIWMHWSADLTPVADFLRSTRSPNIKPLPSDVAVLRAELWAHQAERIALAAEYRRLKASEQAARAARVRADEAGREERHRLRAAEDELSHLRPEIEHMRFNYGRLLADSEERAALAAELNSLRQQIPALQHAIGTLRQERDDLRNSYSWKVTGPLRAVLRLVRTDPVG